MKYHPTGKCFDDSMDFIVEVVKSAKNILQLHPWRLVHGIVNPTGDDRCSHAWVENIETEKIYNSFLDTAGNRIYMEFEPDTFGRFFKIEWQRRYTIREVWDENRRTMNYGPWLPELRALCKPSREARLLEF